METWIKYYADEFPEAKSDFLKVQEDYRKAIEKANKVMGEKLRFAKDWAKVTGTKQEFSAKKHLELIKRAFQERAHEVAREQLNDNERLNKINPEIQRDFKPKKTYEDKQEKLEKKQEELLGKIAVEKERNAFDDEIKEKRKEFIESDRQRHPEIHLLYLARENRDDAESSEYFKDSLRDYFDYDDEKIKRATAVLESQDEKDRLKREELEKHERERKIKEAQANLAEIFDRKNKNRFTL